MKSIIRHAKHIGLYSVFSILKGLWCSFSQWKPRDAAVNFDVYIPKFTAALRGPPCDSTASCEIFVIKNYNFMTSSRVTTPGSTIRLDHIDAQLGDQYVKRSSSCDCALTVAHVLLECNHYNVVRQRYFNVSSLHELFHTVNAQDILLFIRDIGLYRLL